MNERSFIFVPVMRVRDEHKETIIREKAISMIVNEGFDGFSMHKLAKAANVSPATIYIYYKNREDLLNQLFIEVQTTFSELTLKGFNPELSLEKGLWIQWKNRLHFILEYPDCFKFYEQFRNSPLIDHKDLKMVEFKENMKQFVLNAIKRKEMLKMEPEIFWSIAYGSFYALVKFHLSEKTMMGNEFKITDSKLRVVLKMVIKALKP